MNTYTSSKKIALCITAILVILSLSSIAAILWPYGKNTEYTADIYQDGKLIMSIPLSEVEENYRFTIKGTDGRTNEVEVRPGSIAIIAADCPDKLCVNQGFLHDSRLPITCLPNRVVIQLRPNSTQTYTEPDIISH